MIWLTANEHQLIFGFHNDDIRQLRSLDNDIGNVQRNCNHTIIKLLHDE